MNFLATLTGSFAYPAAENPTVAMIEAAFRRHWLEWRYLNCEVPPENLADAVRGAMAMGWVGFNCSLPHKVAVIPHLAGLGASAQLIGAVNCVVRRNGQWIGENTDGQGFLKSLRDVCDPSGENIVVLGAGGAARAIAVELALAGAQRILVVNRSAERGRELVRLLQTRTPAEAQFVPWVGDFRVPSGTRIVVQATSLGLFPRVDVRVPLDLDSLRADMIVADVIPNPPRTRLLREASLCGCRVLDGLGMLVNQGIISLRYWTGLDVDSAVMRECLEAIFASDSTPPAGISRQSHGRNLLGH